MPFENVDLSLANVIPLFYPVVALVTAVALYARAYFVEKAFALHRIE
jgi:hypothetical protein